MDALRLKADGAPADGVTLPAAEAVGVVACPGEEPRERLATERDGLDGGRTRLNAGPSEDGGRPTLGPLANGPPPGV